MARLWLKLGEDLELLFNEPATSFYLPSVGASGSIFPSVGLACILLTFLCHT